MWGRLGSKLIPLLDNERIRWKLGIALILLVNLFGLRFLLTWEQMWVGQENWDTRVMYKSVLQHHEPMEWIVGDWPLHNGFYRPLPALAFDADIHLWGMSYRKYKIFNWLACVASALLLVVFVGTLTQSQNLALASGLLFSAWQTDLMLFLPIQFIASLVAAGVLVYGLFTAPKRWPAWVLIAGTAIYLGGEFALDIASGDFRGRTFGYRTMGWPPGRTATLFALFSLISLIGYCKWERLRRGRWIALAAFGFIGTFMSYEQAVALPAALLACAIFLRLEGVNVRWLPHVVAWGSMALYAWWHLKYLPIEARYKSQHDRSFGGGIRESVLWIFPEYASILPALSIFDPEIGILALMLAPFWLGVTRLFGNVAAWVVGRKEWRLAAFGLGASAAVYAPMGFQIRLNHYLYLPLALRSLFVLGVACAGWRTLLEQSHRKPKSER